MQYIKVGAECSLMVFSDERIIIGLGLPTKYGSTPVAFEISAATEPHAGSAPSLDGTVASGFVAMNRAPELISRIAVVIASKLYVRVSPRTTYSGSWLVSTYPTACRAVV